MESVLTFDIKLKPKASTTLPKILVFILIEIKVPVIERYQFDLQIVQHHIKLNQLYLDLNLKLMQSY